MGVKINKTKQPKNKINQKTDEFTAKVYKVRQLSCQIMTSENCKIINLKLILIKKSGA